MPCTDMNNACASASTMTLRRCGMEVMAGGFTDDPGLPILTKLATPGAQDSHRQLHNRLRQPAQLALPGCAIACADRTYPRQRHPVFGGEAEEPRWPSL